MMMRRRNRERRAMVKVPQQMLAMDVAAVEELEQTIPVEASIEEEDQE